MKYFILIIFLFITAPVLSQPGKITISGTIVDKISKQPIEFVSVELLNKKDSVIIKGSITDKKV